MTCETRARDRIRGCLLAGAVGDALGAPVEFASLAEIRARFGHQGVRDFVSATDRVGAITDDTQMTLFTLEGLVLAARAGALARPGEVVRIAHRAQLRWLRSQGEVSRHPSFRGAAGEGWLLGIADLHARRSPGQSCLSALRSSRMGCIEQPINASKGCGAVMRIAPVGLALAVDDPFRVAVRVAACTHGHPTGHLSAGFLAALVRELVQGAPMPRAIVETQEQLRDWPGHEETHAAVEQALQRGRSESPSPEAVESLGEGWVAEEALAIALYCALTAADLPSGLHLAVNHGGDSDSTGAIAGNLLGAMLGARAIPARWLEALELRAEIERAADELFETLAAPVLARRGAGPRP